MEWGAFSSVKLAVELNPGENEEDTFIDTSW
jgi:hypothetical protein